MLSTTDNLNKRCIAVSAEEQLISGFYLLDFDGENITKHLDGLGRNANILISSCDVISVTVSHLASGIVLTVSPRRVILVQNGHICRADSRRRRGLLMKHLYSAPLHRSNNGPNKRINGWLMQGLQDPDGCWRGAAAC